MSPAWASRPGKGKEVQWPVGLGGKGNEGVAGQVKQTPGAIGYVELIYALQNKISYGLVQNMAGAGSILGANHMNNVAPKDGTIIGHYLIDEPSRSSRWGGKPISQRTLEEMAGYSKQLWPGMSTLVRVVPSWLTSASVTYRHLDAGWAQSEAVGRSLAETDPVPVRSRWNRTSQ